MLASIPQPRLFTWIYQGYVLLFFLYLAVPLVVVGVFAFNDSMFPALPWNGFTWDWFIGKRGVLNDRTLLESIGISLLVAFWVTLLSLLVATGNAFLFEREQFPLKNFLYVLMLTPLVIPGVILGISILVFSNTLANGLEELFGLELESLRPGLTLVVLGQFAFITTIATLIISARLRKFDRSLEEAARNLGATQFTAIRTLTLPYLRPAMLGAGIVSFLISFENFNTTLMLVGSDPPLTIAMFDRLREGSTPALNAVSLLLMLVSGTLAMISVFVQRVK
jgi:spermidine/putrescine transport system permease protein